MVATLAGCSSATEPLSFVTIRTDSVAFERQANVIHYGVTIVNRGTDTVLLSASCDLRIVVGLRWSTRSRDSFGQTDRRGVICNGPALLGPYRLPGGQSVSVADQHPLVYGEVFTPIVLVGQGELSRSIESDSFDDAGRILPQP